MSVNSRPSVVVVGPLPPPANGMTSMTEHVLSSSLRRAFALLHIDTSDHRPISRVERLDLQNVWLALRHGLAFARALTRRPDLAYIPVARNRLGFLRDSLFLLASRLVRTPRIVHFHGRGFADFYASEPGWMRLLVRLCLGGETHAIVLGESRQAEFAGLIPTENVHVVPNGLPDIADADVARRPRDRLVLHLSTLSREKGAFDVLEAARRLRDELPDAQFVFAGDWLRSDERAEALAFLARHRLEQRVKFVGPVYGRAKSELLARAAVMAFPSRYPYEAHPLVVLEALCCGTPVVATPIGCIPETVVDGREAFLVADDDPALLASRIRDLLTDEAQRLRMAENARSRYQAEYTLERFADRLAAVWKLALQQRHQASPAVSALPGSPER